MPRAVARPYMLRPPLRFRVSTRRRSGLVLVMSLKSAYAIYRVDGVSGLNVFTGINHNHVSQVSNLEDRAINPAPRRANAVIGSAGYAVRTPLTVGERNGEYI